MGRHRGKYRLNKADGKVLGVCAGIADHFDVDVTLVRVGMTLAILLTFPVMLFAYFVLAMVAQSGGRGRLVREERAEAPRLTDPAAEATRQRVRDLDARMAAIETYVTSSNTALAREIDGLR
ncbi:MAG TPA: PspC domain-containing protein [Allosphingosinicella sp.]